jgi:hypothetical protein
MATDRAEEDRRDQRDFEGNSSHLERLLDGVERGNYKPWNAWRRAHPRLQPNLRGANLQQAHLSGFHLEGADLTGARLDSTQIWSGYLADAHLERASFTYASLQGANLPRAHLREANLVSADLSLADLSHADLRGALLVNANLNGARLHGANLRQAAIVGANLWNIATDADTQQEDLVLNYIPSGDPLEWAVGAAGDAAKQPHLRSHFLETAHFLWLIVNQRKKLTDILNTTSQHMVLILSRFGSKREKVLDVLRVGLRKKGYAPITFDFESPDQLDLVETIMALAFMSRFVIADVSEPKSVPLEAHAIIPHLRIPFVPIVHVREKPFSMLSDLQVKYEWVMPTVTYRSAADLARHLQARIIAPANDLRASLRSRRLARLRRLQMRRARRRRVSRG